MEQDVRRMLCDFRFAAVLGIPVGARWQNLQGVREQRDCAIDSRVVERGVLIDSDPRCGS